MRTASRTKGTSASGSHTRNRATSAAVRIGSANTGPGSKSISHPMPSRGIMMSENRMAASTPSRSMGWSVTSHAISGLWHTSRKEYFARTARYSSM